MNFLLNVLWIFFGGGFVIALEYLLAGLVLCLTIIGIPFGLQCFKMAGLGLLPFGKDIREDPGAGVASGLGNILWFLLAGVWIFLSHIALAAGLAVTIIGIPFALQHLKLGLLALTPFGKRVVVAA
ncbi:MAG: YccF domain-containing protein [Myxococcales bacterium]|nr:YccF domain-containing protein [Myxococcales bacterium]